MTSSVGFSHARASFNSIVNITMAAGRYQQFSPWVRGRLENGTAPNFLKELGIWPTFVDKGHAEFAMKVVPKVYQQHEYVHGGAVTTIADHTAGCVAITMTKE